MNVAALRLCVAVAVNKLVSTKELESMRNVTCADNNRERHGMVQLEAKPGRLGFVPMTQLNVPK